MGDTRILVTGWRDWPESHAHVIHEAIEQAAEAVGGPFGRVVVVHGQCPYGGVDLYAAQWARKHDLASEEPHPAERDRSGRILGPARNSKMVSLGADICLAFP